MIKIINASSFSGQDSDNDANYDKRFAMGKINNVMRTYAAEQLIWLKFLKN